MYIFTRFGYDVLVLSEDDDCMSILLSPFASGLTHFLTLLEVNGSRYDTFFFKKMGLIQIKSL